MPLTGTYAAVGQRAASMVELGLEDGLEGNIKITIYDVADEYKASNAISKIKANGTKLVLGPIFSSQTSDVFARLSSNNITMISLSNNPALARDNLYIFGHAPAHQAERVVNYMLDHHYKNFITLLPAGKYSNQLSEIIANMVSTKGGMLVRSESYIAKEESINAAIDDIAKIVEELNESPDNIQKPVIYLSDEAHNLEKIVAEMKKRNLHVSTVIIGDNKLDLKYDEPISYIFAGSIEYNADNLLTRLKKQCN
ncbi:MAG UNVERIFIED_CONTAM: penicillin-binding protein activator [Rickettsiaceae bacterium]|jgi:ABC-type branched-subunit amino acid transport system substrate-binding protein